MAAPDHTDRSPAIVGGRPVGQPSALELAYRIGAVAFSAVIVAGAWVIGGWLATLVAAFFLALIFVGARR